MDTTQPQNQQIMFPTGSLKRSYRAWTYADDGEPITKDLKEEDFERSCSSVYGGDMRLGLSTPEETLFIAEEEMQYAWSDTSKQRLVKAYSIVLGFEWQLAANDKRRADISYFFEAIPNHVTHEQLQILMEICLSSFTIPQVFVNFSRGRGYVRTFVPIRFVREQDLLRPVNSIILQQDCDLNGFSLGSSCIQSEMMDKHKDKACFKDGLFLERFHARKALQYEELYYKHENMTKSSNVFVKSLALKDQYESIVKRPTMHQPKMLPHVVHLSYSLTKGYDVLRFLVCLRGHPNIPFLLDWYLEYDRLIIILPHYRGAFNGNLKECLGDDPSAVKCFMKQLLEALAVCHSHSLVHGNVKPDNITFHKDSKHLTLIDFGDMQLQMKGCDGNTRCNSVRGNSSYRCPETSDKFCTAADIWASGILFTELLIPQESIFRNSDINDDASEGEMIPDFTWFPRAAQDLIRKMLDLDHKKRITAEDALRHEYFLSNDVATDAQQSACEEPKGTKKHYEATPSAESTVKENEVQVSAAAADCLCKDDLATVTVASTPLPDDGETVATLESDGGYEGSDEGRPPRKNRGKRKPETLVLNLVVVQQQSFGSSSFRGSSKILPAVALVPEIKTTSSLFISPLFMRASLSFPLHPHPSSYHCRITVNDNAMQQATSRLRQLSRRNSEDAADLPEVLLSAMTRLVVEGIIVQTNTNASTTAPKRQKTPDGAVRVKIASGECDLSSDEEATSRKRKLIEIEFIEQECMIPAVSLLEHVLDAAPEEIVAPAKLARKRQRLDFSMLPYNIIFHILEFDEVDLASDWSRVVSLRALNNVLGRFKADPNRSVVLYRRSLAIRALVDEPETPIILLDDSIVASTVFSQVRYLAVHAYPSTRITHFILPQILANAAPETMPLLKSLQIRIETMYTPRREGIPVAASMFAENRYLRAKVTKVTQDALSFDSRDDDLMSMLLSSYPNLCVSGYCVSGYAHGGKQFDFEALKRSQLKQFFSKAATLSDCLQAKKIQFLTILQEDIVAENLVRLIEEHGQHLRHLNLLCPIARIPKLPQLRSLVIAGFDNTIAMFPELPQLRILKMNLDGIADSTSTLANLRQLRALELRGSNESTKAIASGLIPQLFTLDIDLGGVFFSTYDIAALGLDDLHSAVLESLTIHTPFARDINIDEVLLALLRAPALQQVKFRNGSEFICDRLARKLVAAGYFDVFVADHVD